MKEFFANLWKDYIFSAVLTIVAGVLITLFHSVAIDVVCIALGIATLILGIISIIRFIKEPLVSNRLGLFFGLILSAVGVYIICVPTVLANLVAVVFGIVILYHGIIDCVQTVSLRKVNYKYWYVGLIISILTILSGIVMIILQNRVIKSLTLLLGIFLIIEGVMNLWMAVKVKKING